MHEYYTLCCTPFIPQFLVFAEDPDLLTWRETSRAFQLLSFLASSKKAVYQGIYSSLFTERVKQRLLKPLRSSQRSNKSIKPLRRRKEIRRRALIEEFDPYPPYKKPTVTNYQNELLRIYDTLEGEKAGRRFIRFTFSQRLTQNLTPSEKG